MALSRCRPRKTTAGKDFAKHRIDHRRWLARETGWLAKKDGVWVKGEYSPGDFRMQHPQVYAQIEAEAEKWMPAVAAHMPLFEAVKNGQNEA